MKEKMYRVYVKKETEYVIKANSKEQACDIADELLSERSFDDYSITEIDEEKADFWDF